MMVAAAPAALVSFFEPWADLYGDSKFLETVVQFLHIGGLLMAGGLAIAADRGTLRAVRLSTADRHGHLSELAGIHRWVQTGLAVVIVSGVALFAADVETFVGSWLFWAKMIVVVALLANGFAMTRAERALGVDAGDDSPAWKALHRSAMSSLSLWIVLAAMGVALTNYS